MTKLKSFAKAKQQRPPGLRAELLITYAPELAAWPRTKAEISATGANGETVILDEPFDFSTAPAGEGYWRKYNIIVSSAKLDDTIEGELGGQGIYSMLAFQLAGTAAEEIEFANLLVAGSGCFIAAISDKNGQYRILGNLTDPAYIVSGGILSSGAKIGDVKGGTYTLRSDTGYASPIYDANTHGFDLTPNP